MINKKYFSGVLLRERNNLEDLYCQVMIQNKGYSRFLKFTDQFSDEMVNFSLFNTDDEDMRTI